jgi:hypothetical protein
VPGVLWDLNSKHRSTKLAITQRGSLDASVRVDMPHGLCHTRVVLQHE